MGKTRRISKNQCAAPWSDLNHHLLSLVLMKLEVVDFLPFSGVCKSWRSLALSNKSDFMESRPPMSIWISEQAKKKEYMIEDFKGKMFKMRLPKSGGGRRCVGLTHGYLVLFGTKPREFWLLNPVTRHGLRFPRVPSYFDLDLDLDEEEEQRVRAILVFSSSISAWMFLVLCRYSNRICYSIVGKREWDYVSYTSGIVDFHDFKGKIYAIDIDSRLYELGLDPKPKLTLLNTTNIIESDLIFLEFVRTDENLYAIECSCEGEYEVHELDFGEMKWVSPDEKTMEETAFFLCDLKHSAAIKPGVWFDSWLRYKRTSYEDAYEDTSGNDMFFTADIWYFAHDCLKVHLKHE